MRFRLSAALLGGPVFVAVGLLAPVGAADSPLHTVRTTIDRIVAVFESPEYRGADRRIARIERVGAIVRPLIDEREVARRTLGVYWRDRTDAQRAEFTAIFMDLVEKSYGETFDRQARKYLDTVQFLYDKETIDGDFAEVGTRLFLPPQNKYFAINYRFHKVGGQWLVYDVVVENVSMVRNFRTQFYRIIGKSSYEDLVRQLRAKIERLATTRPAD